MNTIRRNKNSVKNLLALITIIAVFCLMSTNTAEAAVEVDAVSSNSTIGTTITISHTTSGTNRLMLVGVSFNNDNLEIVTGVTYNSVALTPVGTIRNADDARVEIWRLIAPDTGTHDVVVTFSADLIQEGFAGVVTFTGVHQTTPLGNFASAIGDGITATVDVSSATGELVFDVLASEYSTSATVGAGQTERWNLYRTSSMGTGSTEPGAPTVTMSWTLTGAGDHWAIYGVSVKPAAAGASDLDQIHYRWRNDNGGEEDGDTTQVSATADTTTTSTSDVLVDSMTITPGAGDYHIWFSGSVECSATSYQYVSLYVNGVQEAHTERQIRTEGSIPDNPFVVATHARVIGVTAGQAIEVRWRTTAGTATIHERTLAVTKITAADSTQTSATADTTTSSTTYTSLNSMSITPGAGDYMVWFSASMEGNTGNSRQDISIFVDGSEIPHTERQMYTESSILSTSFPVATHAKLTSVGASEAIEVRWRTTAGTATMHERTLVVYKINASDFTQVSATADATTTSATDVLISGMTITPGAGDYLVWFSSSLECDLANNLNSQFVSIYVNGTQVAHTERELLQEESLGGTEYNVMTHACIENVGASDAIEVRWRRANAGTATMFERTLVVQSTSTGSGATWAANQDTSLTNLAKNTTRRLRLEVSNEGTGDSGNIAYRLEVSEPNPASPSTASYTRVDSSTHWNMTASTYFTDGDLTSNISPGLFDENTTFVDGRLKESTDETTTIALSTTQFTEIEYTLQATGSAIDGATYYFRLTNAGVDSDFTYTSYAQVSLAGVAASLTLADHASGQVSDKFTATSPLTDVLYRFKLTRSGTVTVDNMRVNFTTSGGVANGDVSSGELWEDADNDGVVDDPGDTQIQGSVTPSSGVLTFTNNFSPGTGGTNYLVRATVSNLTGGDATTFSVSTADIDEVEGGVTESGSISNVTHTQDSTTFTTNYRSIGTNTGTLYNTGNASISSGTTTVTFGGGASLPEPTAVGAVGVGDELVIGSETFYILSRDNATQVTVQSAATSTHSNASYTITRAYNDIQTWENDRDGNLVLNDYVEVGVCYKDGPFMPTATTTIDGSTTDATRYMLLTVATGQQHSGTAGTGVVVDGSNIVSSHVFHVRDTYFRMELLEIRNYPGNTVTGQPINLSEGNAGNNLLSKLIIHDYTSTGRGAINVYENSTVRNCIFYNGDKGIRTYSNSNLTFTMENVTIYNMTGIGVDHQKGKLIVKNTISVGSGISRDFDLDNDAPVDGSSGYNMYSGVHNNIHPGASSGLISISFDGPGKTITRTTGSFLTDGFVIGNIINTDSGSNPGPFTVTNVTALVITVSEAVTTQAASSRDVFLDVASVIRQSPPASLDDLFISISSGSENLHIESSGHNALDNGQDLSGSFTDDIDGDTRPQGSGWDIGADESRMFLYRKKITIDHTKVGSNCSSDLSDFPMLVSLTGNWLKTTTVDPTNGRIENTNGYDIIFRASDGTTQLDHEIEQYDGTNGKLVAWVRIPTLSYTADTDIYIYYGNDSVTDLTGNPTGVWDGNYVGVLHLGEEYALDFDGLDDYVDIPTSSSLNITIDKITIDAWVKFNADFNSSATQDQTLIDGGGKIEYWWENSDGKLHLSLSTGGWLGLVSTKSSWSAGVWYHIVGVYDGTNKFLYIDGVEDNSQADSGNLDTTVFGIHISNPSAGANEGPFNGIIDEVHIWNRALDSTEISDLYQGKPVSRTGLVGEWLMNEGTGNTVSDSSGEGNDGDMTGHAATWKLRAKDSTSNANHGTGYGNPTYGVGGKIDGSIDFDGIDDYIDCENLLNFSITNFTLEAWIRAHVINQVDQNTFLSKWHATQGQREFRFEIDGPGADNVIFSTEDGTTYYDLNAGTTVIQTNTWYYAAVTVDWAGDDAYLYLDAQVEDSEVNTWTQGMNYETSPLLIASRRGVDQWFDGEIDEVRISKIARSACWLQTSHNNQNSPSNFYNEGSEEDVGDAYLAEHAAGQETDSFGAISPVTGAELFAFKLTNETGSQVTVSEVQFQLSSVTGIVQGDFSNLAIYVDSNNDGAIGGGETTTVGGTGTVNAGVTTITFSTAFNISASTTVNYIMTGDVSNLVQNDTITIGLGTSNITLTSGRVGGSAPTSVTHTADAACEYSSWRQITIDNTKVSGTSDLTNFPLLVSLSGDWLKTTTADTTNGRITNSNGYDIIFKDTSGTQLDHEIEKYDGTNGILVAWVRIPTLSYNIDTVIYIHYGNPCISSSQENITGVWDANYVGVWHLSEDPSGTAPQMNDSTSNTNHGTSAGTMLTEDQITGKVDGSLDFDGSDDCVDVGNLQSLAGSSELTMFVWFYARTLPAVLGDNYGIFMQHDDWDEQMGMRFDGNSERLNAYVETGAVAANVSLVYSGNVVNNTWYHAVLTFNNGVVELFLDGVSKGTDDQSGTFTTLPDLINNMFIASLDQNSNDYFDGIIDEVRISDIARTADWIQTEYNNQDDPSTFCSVGDEGAGCSYSHKKPITIQSSQVSGTTDHTNFPALVSLTDTALRHIDSGGHVTNTNGYDIIFKASDETTQLDHEIEKYDGTNGTLVAWVRIPTLDYDTDTVIYMYYGNTCTSASQENVTGVWDSNYKGVWHLKEIPTVDSYAYDSTSNNNDGTFEASMTSGDQVAGEINGSLDFDGNDDFVRISEDDTIEPSAITISYWVKRDGVQMEYAKHVYKTWQDDGSPTYQSYGFEHETDSQIGFYIGESSGYTGIYSASDALPNNTWVYVVGTYDPSGSSPQQKIYINAGIDDSTTNTAAILYDTGTDADLYFAVEEPSSPAYRFDGAIDEVRISDTDRSADWIQTEYNNQNTPSSFYNEGSEESAGTVSLGNHAAGQETDNFSTTSPVTGAELFAFKLTNTTSSTVNVKKLLFPLSLVTGIAQGDFSNLAIYVDANNDGTIGGGETTTVGGAGEVNAGVTDITFSDDFSISATTAVNYILVGDVSNLLENDTVTIGLNPTDVTITAGHVGGSAPTSATHTSDAQCTFAYRRPITIQFSKVSGTADLTDFPALISLSGTWLRTSTADPTNGHIENANGYDIIFRDSTGTYQLDHEIEDYDGSGSGGTLVAWVGIPTLKGNENTVIYMYYGNGCINSSTENVTGVWNSNYVGVWHLKENGNGSVDEYKDSTQYTNHGQGGEGDSLFVPTQVSGKISYGQDFNNSDGKWDLIDCGNDSELDITEKLITLEAWIKYPNATHPWMGFLNHKGWDNGYRLIMADNSQKITLQLPGNSHSLTTQQDISTNVWHHFVATYDGITDQKIRIYIDGIKDTNELSKSDNLLSALPIGVWIGHGDQPKDVAWSYEWEGQIDEVRISNTAHTADWILTEYNNQNDPATFYNIGNEETPAPTAVDLISFTATGQDENVLVEWETAQEIDNLGFNLYRSTELGGSYSKLNSRLIPGLLSSVVGQQYTYVDRDVTRSVLYFYMLEDVDLDGTRTMHGPISVDWDGDGTPDDYIEDPDDDTDTDTEEEDPEVSIPDTEFDELESDHTDWTPSNIGGSASWVKLASFKAYEQDDGVALEWETSYEIDNLGFQIYRELDGKFYRVTPDLVPGSVFSVGEGSELPAGQSYAYWDALSKQTGREFYWLDSIELNGGRASFGPIEPEISGKPIHKGRQARFKSIADYQVSKAQARGKVKALREELSAAPIRVRKSRAIFYEVVPDNKPSEPRLPPSEEQWALSAQPGVKIYVKEDGWYRVGEQELVAAGLRPGIDPRYLQLYRDGVEQSILVIGDEDGRFDPLDAIEFYGTGLDTPFTDAHVYWLVVGSRPGRRLDTPFTDIRVGPDKKMRVPRGLRGRGGTLSFPYTVELKERTFYFAALKSGERDNFFGSVISTEPVDQLLTLPNRAPSSPRGTMLEVGLQGATDAYHQVRILFNYRDAYDVGFSGQLGGRVEIQISQENLLEGDNIVTLTAQGGSMDISLVDYVRITYWRTYTADDDLLRFKATGGEWLSIGGFSSPGIRVVDITDPVRMLNVRGKVKPDGSGYAITIKVPGGGERTLLAFTEEKIKSPAGIAANIASSWHELSQGADVVIIGHSDLLESVRPLKELREQQGLSVVLVDVEDLYDEFNFGAKSPWAMKDFLAQAYLYWNPQPRYLILVGDTSYDPRNYLGYGEFDLMPTKLVDTERLKTASDDWFVDFNDDELPEMAVGRLPAASAGEVTAVVAKIFSYEGAAGLMNEVLLVSDINDYFNFEQASTKVAELIPENMTVNEIFRGRSATAKSDLLDLLSQGQLLVNYFGHGSTQIWHGNLLTYSDALSLTNSPNLPFFVSTTCLNGFFQDPYSESLAEGLLKAEFGGAVAVWTSSGLTDPEDQLPLNEKLIKLLFNGQGLTIGEAVMRAKQAATDRDVRRTWILFGDPTLRLR